MEVCGHGLCLDLSPFLHPSEDRVLWHLWESHHSPSQAHQDCDSEKF